MFRFLIAALAVSSTAAFTPAPVSRIVSSRVASTNAEPLVFAPRVAEAQMSAVTEKDADGNPVTHYEMFDAGWVVITLGFYSALMVKIALG
mmetsp:Transcript_35154/g.92291  ORF Transcript_35154/g.92291 Transcript_35154/m.92291 type:complete len:91 (+) Transcript_35154:58-330(+)